jgi:hypothetical protein
MVSQMSGFIHAELLSNNEESRVPSGKQVVEQRATLVEKRPSAQMNPAAQRGSDRALIAASPVLQLN